MFKTTGSILIMVLILLTSCSQKYQRTNDIQNDKIYVYFYLLKSNEAGFFDYGKIEKDPEIAKQFKVPVAVNIWQDTKDAEAESRYMNNEDKMMRAPFQMYCYFICDKTQNTFTIKFRDLDSTNLISMKQKSITLDLREESENQIFIKLEELYVPYNGDQGFILKREPQINRITREVAEKEIKDCTLVEKNGCCMGLLVGN